MKKLIVSLGLALTLSFGATLDEGVEAFEKGDYKTALQEITQAKFASIPEYKIEGSYGPDHKKEFEVSIWIDGVNYGSANGKSKKLAQQAVAKIAIEKLKED